MTTEQRKAIENLSEIVNLSKEELQKENENITAILDYEDLKSLDTVLSLIKKQQEEIENTKELYDRALSDLVKADKQIDLMADYIGKEDITEIFCDGKIGCDENCKTCVKQYFERQVNSSKQ